jgi:DNA-binding FadR family transcriptional regulator
MMIVTIDTDASTVLEARKSRAELMAQELAREIGEQHAPGDRIGTKEDLRRRFGVAVATVNEAVRMLETHGLVEARPGPGGGVFVSGPATRLTLKHIVLGFKSGTSYEECLEVRDALEPAIERHAARRATAADIRELELVLEQMAGSLDNPRRFFAIHWGLHRQIGMLCGNAPLRAMYLSLVDFLEAQMNRAEFVDFQSEPLLKVHQEIVAAIAKGEGAQLERAVARHQPTQF